MKKYAMIALASAIILSGCSQASEEQSQSNGSSSSTAQTTKLSTKSSSESSGEDFGKYQAEDLETDYDASSATKIKLASAETKAVDGVTVDGQEVTITKAGTYVISGMLTDGQLRVNVGKEEQVRLILNGVTITNNDGPAIDIQQTEKTIVTLAADKTNTLTDGSSYQLATGETEPDATIYSKEDLVINGTGTLKVTGNYSNGIRSKDDLVLISGNYEVTAKNNALKGKDSVSIKDGTYQLTTSEGDGIQANNSEDTAKGWVAVDGGKLTIQSGRDGIQAETNLSLQKAEINITTADGAQATTVDSNESYKGLKAGGALLVASGQLTIDSADDSLHSNDTVTISGGKITAKSGDDGIHADNNLTIKDGTVDIQQSYEGLESSVIDLKGGTVHVAASDDGVNAGGGSDTTESTGMFGGDSFGGGGPGGGDTADESKQVNISGGTLTIDAEGDGLDSNGNVTMTGGTVAVNGPTRGGNGALDYNGTFTFQGGTLVAAGTTDMAMNVSEASNSTAVGIYFDSTMTAGDLISLQDSNGKNVLSYAPTKNFQHLVVVSDQLSQGTYQLVSGGDNDGQAEGGIYSGGTVSGGTKLGELALTSAVNDLTQAGETASGRSMGGGGGTGR